jgi:hypothetical protein
MNMFLVANVLDLPMDDLQVMLFDKFSDGPYLELIQKAYSRNHPVIRHQAYSGKKVRKPVEEHYFISFKT